MQNHIYCISQARHDHVSRLLVAYYSIFPHKNKTLFFSVILPTLSKRAASCLHFIFNDCHSSYDKLLDKINWPSLHNRRIHDMLTLVYKSFHDLAPSYINELLRERNSSDNLCGKHSLSIPRVQSTKYGLHSFPYSASKYWNMFPELLRTAESLHVFKSKVKSISFDNKCCSFCNQF